MTMKKSANPVGDSFLGALRHGFVQSLKSPAALGMMVAPFAAAGIRKYETHRQAQESVQGKTLAYREMMDLHPHFKQRDQAEIGRIYNSLHNASPNMARDPLVAGAWVDNILENRHPGMNSHQALLNAVKDLNGIQKNVSDMERNRTSSPKAEAASQWIRDYSQQVDKNVHNSIEAQLNNAKEILGKQHDEIKKERGALTEQRHAMIEREAFDKRWGEIERREEALRQREGRGKTSSARTSLGEMLRALKVQSIWERMPSQPLIARTNITYCGGKSRARPVW